MNGSLHSTLAPQAARTGRVMAACPRGKPVPSLVQATVLPPALRPGVLAARVVGVQSFAAKKAASFAARTGSKINVGKAAARTSIEEVQNAAREVDSQATRSSSVVTAGALVS